MQIKFLPVMAAGLFCSSLCCHAKSAYENDIYVGVGAQYNRATVADKYQEVSDLPYPIFRTKGLGYSYKAGYRHEWFGVELGFMELFPESDYLTGILSGISREELSVQQETRSYSVDVVFNFPELLFLTPKIYVGVGILRTRNEVGDRVSDPLILNANLPSNDSKLTYRGGAGVQIGFIGPLTFDVTARYQSGNDSFTSIKTLETGITLHI